MWSRVGPIGIGAVILTLAVAGCSGGGSPKASPSQKTGGTVTFAEQPGAAPNYLFPVLGPGHFTGANYFRLVTQLYRPLYWMATNGKLQANPQLSLAQMPVFSNGDTTVTITLKPWQWSNGDPITARDVAFWQNVVSSDPAAWAASVPDQYPSNIVKTTIVNSSTIKFSLSRAYNPQWFLYNELSQITPMPQKVWDKTSVGGKVGNYDESPSGAKAVYTFLNTQASDTSTYSTNPLWKVVDGAWKLKSYSLNGPLVFTRNAKYSGPVTANFSTFVEEPYTTDVAEFDALQSGNLDYGYLPPNDVSQAASLKSSGYNVEQWPHWGINFIEPNYHNPLLGATFSQRYVREALEELVDQPKDIQAFFGGYATPTYGPVPAQPKTDFLPSIETTNLYPYSPAHAAALLSAHGWSVNSGGVLSCNRPGTGTSQCGAGVKAGTAMSINLLYPAGVPALSGVMQAFASAASTDHISIQLQTQPFDTVVSSLVACQPAQAACSWELIADGNGWGYGLDYLPVGDEIFATGAASNSASFSNAQVDQLITATHFSSSSAVVHQDATAVTKVIPYIWIPELPVQVSAIKSNLVVGAQGPLLAISPELWKLAS